MTHDNVISLENKVFENGKTDLELLVKEGARKMLMAALEEEVREYIENHKDLKDKENKRLVVRNGTHKERQITTGIGPIEIKQPRVNDRRSGETFSSSILPRYLRRLPSIDNLVPVLYLKEISTGDFTEALEAILGKDCPGLSPSGIVRLKKQWKEEYEDWCKRDLSEKEYVYFWVDGIHFNVRLASPENKKQCFLIIIGATAEGRKDLVAVQDGYRESEESWKGVLLDLKLRGLQKGPELAVGDGALGFWKAIQKEYPETRCQRCWVHKTANILDKMPKSVQDKAKKKIHDIYLASTKEAAEDAYETFLKLYGVKYEKACQCLTKDRDVLFTFYDFPAEHWGHIRTTNPIESTFATVRLRTKRTKGCGSRDATLMMVFKLVQQAEKHWQKLNGYKLIPKVLKRVKFIDGIEEGKEVVNL